MKIKIYLFMSMIFIALAAAGVVKVKKVNAALPMAWIWGGSEYTNDGTNDGDETGLGWVSLNSSNAGAGSGATYGVDIPSTDGPLKGFAWSSNVGYIDFDPQDNCGSLYNAASCFVPNSSTSKGGVFRSGNNLTGWARIVGVATESAGNNSGGWSGWIQMDANPALGYAVTIGNDGKLSGYAWNGEGTENGFATGLGAIAFDAQQILLPKITLTVSPQTIDVDNNNNGPWSVTLSWSVDNATACHKSGGNWSGDINNPTPGYTYTETISQSLQSVNYQLVCDNSAGSSTATVNVSSFCYNHTCGSGTDFGSCTAVPVASTTSAACTQQNCTMGGTDCALRSTGAWKEVAP